MLMELVATCMCNSMDSPHMLMYMSRSYLVCRNVVDFLLLHQNRMVSGVYVCVESWSSYIHV